MSTGSDKINLIPVKRWDLADIKNTRDLALVLTLPQDFDSSSICGNEIYFHLSRQNIYGIVESLQSQLGGVIRDPNKPLN